MKKIIFIFLLSVTFQHQSRACADYSVDSDYYNLFMQEIVNDPRYYPFLMSLESAYYTSDQPDTANENIKEWQQYLSLSYNNTYYLVFSAARDQISAAVNSKPVSDAKLSFLTPEFVKTHKQALLYLAYAKYLEPYMRITHVSSSDWDYYPEDTKTAANLVYEKVMTVLRKSWTAETDKELKLRYGYQMVRFAHYNRNYEEAIRLFDEYVEPLNFKPAIYYYALAQKAGAVRGNGDMMLANDLFFQVFVHSGDLKVMALNSIRLNNEADFSTFLDDARTDKERNDAHLLLGFANFNNPINEAEKIVATSPDAIQAKVLTARAVNQIERESVPVYQYLNGDDLKAIKDKRFPMTEGSEFLQQALAFVSEMAGSSKVKDKNYWNITASYLYFLKKDFASAKTMLAKVSASDEKYSLQKKNLSMYIDISEQPKITPALEAEWFTKYADVFKAAKPTEYYDNTSRNFVIDVLANRYILQKDYAKSFLLSNDISVLERNPQLYLIDEIEKFIQKPDKNALEKFIATTSKKTNAQAYLYHLRGIVYLTYGDLNKADAAFQQAKAYISTLNIPNKIFGYNKIECFECSEQEVMGTDYLAEFPAIPKVMDYASLTKVLLKLQKEGNGTGLQAAKANYLLGNFFYNVTPTGYYRNVLRFSDTNSYYSNVYDWFRSKPDILNNVYLKYYDFYYENQPLDMSRQYLEKAYQMASNDELKARIVFALSKQEQELYYSDGYITGGWNFDGDQILIKDRSYFAELMKYRQTNFFTEVKTNCKYFEYYVNHYQ